MATVNCPACGKPNPDTVEICQYCGTALKRSATVPLPPIHPGDMPIRRKTSDLESTLPGWLRDARRASDDEKANSMSTEKPAEEPKPVKPATPPPPPPATPKPKASASPLDLLAGLSQVNDEEEEVPDWLKSLQGNVPTPATELAPTVPVPEQPAEEPADWLSGLQSDARENEPPAASEPDWGFGDQPATFNFDDSAASEPLGPAETPDWLNALKAQADEPAAPAPAKRAEVQPTSADDTPDWLAALSDSSIGVTPFETAPRPVEQQPPAQPNNDTPDWLSSLGAESAFPAEQPPATNAPSAASDDAPDWLSALSEPGLGEVPTQPEPEPAAQQPTQRDDTPDWLSSLGMSEVAPVEQRPEEPAPFSSETPDWLSALGDNSAGTAEPQSPASTNTPADDTPDWLASLGGGFDASEPAAPAEAADLPSVETPDWLSGLDAETVTPAEPAASEALPPAGTADADLPPWLSDLTSNPQPVEPLERPVQETPQTAPQAFESDLPDWMMDLQGTPAPAAESPVSPELAATEPPISDDVPDWMKGFAAEQPSISTPEPAPSTDSELPSWLAEAVGESPAEKPVEPPQASKPFNTGALREFGPLDNQGVTPDWLAGLGGMVETPASAESAPSAEELPRQMESATPEAASAAPMFGEEQNLDSILSMDMPDWLSGFTPTEAETSEASGAEKISDENISPADLPSWVQAMRPVEDVMGGKISSTEEDDAPVENQGPLAGLRSVLPAQTGVSLLHKPKTYSIKLQVDETQQAQAALLENILNSENTPQAASSKARALVIRPLRWIIAGVLLAAIILGAFLQDIVGSQVFPSPAMSAGHTQIQNFVDLVKNLPSDSAVLVVADYQPGFAGELEPAAEPVMSQLMAKNVHLAFVSTSTTGSYMAERLLHNKYTQKYSYEAGTQYVNLGYLPGGAGGIQVFAEQPAATIGGDLWNTGVLKSVNVENAAKLSNFSAVLILTDNPDTGRLWIEQAQPFLDKKPLLMVISAQAEPMVRPYLASGQVTGMVSGLEDGVLYEGLTSNLGQARSYWDAFGVAVLVAELMIVVGGVWSLSAGILARRSKKTEQDDV